MFEQTLATSALELERRGVQSVDEAYQSTVHAAMLTGIRNDAPLLEVIRKLFNVDPITHAACVDQVANMPDALSVELVLEMDTLSVKFSLDRQSVTDSSEPWKGMADSQIVCMIEAKPSGNSSIGGKHPVGDVLCSR